MGTRERLVDALQKLYVGNSSCEQYDFLKHNINELLDNNIYLFQECERGTEEIRITQSLLDSSREECSKAEKLIEHLEGEVADRNVLIGKLYDDLEKSRQQASKETLVEVREQFRLSEENEKLRDQLEFVKSAHEQVKASNTTKQTHNEGLRQTVLEKNEENDILREEKEQLRRRIEIKEELLRRCIKDKDKLLNENMCLWEQVDEYSAELIELKREREESIQPLEDFIRRWKKNR